MKDQLKIFDERRRRPDRHGFACSINGQTHEIHFGFEGCLWYWSEHNGQTVVASSRDAAPWLELHCTDPDKDRAIAVASYRMA